MKSFRTQLTQKLIGIAGVFLLMLPSARAQIQTLPFYEPFGEYSENEYFGAVGSSGDVWTLGGTATPSSAKITTNAALSFFGLQGDTNAAPKGVKSSAISNKNRGVVFTAQTNGSVYASFLLQMLTNPTAPRIITCLSSASSSAGIPPVNLGVYVDAWGHLILTKNNNPQSDPPYDAPMTSPLIESNTYLVVIRYTFNPGTDDDEVALWLNPTHLGDGYNVSTPDITYSNGTDATVIQSLAYMCPTASPIATFNWDEVRIATNWFFPPPPPCDCGSNLHVICEGNCCAPCPVGLDGSSSNCDYSLIRNGFYTGQTISGTGSAISFGIQTNGGIFTVIASNRIDGLVGWSESSAIVQSPPTIVTQPVDTVACTNGQATFSVLASGGDLTFQWRRNGTNLTDHTPRIYGSTSSNLTISPVTVADFAGKANGYDCIICGSCSPCTNTVRVALTPCSEVNLYWVGMLPDTTLTDRWDVAITNWTTNHCGFPNRGSSFGENVVFDDCAMLTMVNVASPFLTPSTVTLNSSLDWWFYGSGSITGPGSVVYMNNTGVPGGSVSITNANSYTGGTTISNITVNIVNKAALGVGPVTLKNHAELSTYEAFELANAINLASNATIQVNTPGPLMLDGSLSGRGTIQGSVMLYGTLSPGDSAIGILTITNALILQAASATHIKVNKTTGTNDLVTGLTNVTYGGMLVVTNLSGTLTTNDSFKIFDAMSYSGAFVSVTPPPGLGLVWDISTLTSDGTLRIAPATSPVIKDFNIQSGTNLVFSGTNSTPANGYSVWSSTNLTLPLTNWVLESSGIFDGSGVFSVTNVIQPNTTNKFFLLRLP